MPNIHLEYLPEYSPDYNLIELVWHQLLNEGGLIIKWGRKLKNKGNAIITV